MSDQWFPRFSPSGPRLAYGSKVISVNGAVVGPGTSPRWLSEDALVYTRQPDGALMHWPSGQVLDVSGFNDVDACAGRWAGWHAGRDEIVTSWGLVLPGCRMPRLSATGLVYAQPSGDGWRIVGLDGTVIGDGAIRDLRVSPEGAVVWSQHVEGRWETTGLGALHCSEGDEFWPVPLDTPSGQTWVLSHTHTALWLRPWGEDRGYVVAEGTTDFPDARWTEAGWTVVWSDRGDLRGRLIAHDTPRVVLVDTAPAPPPQPVDPEEPNDMAMLDTLKRLRANYGPTMTDDECVALCNDAAWEHRAEGYGVSRKEFGTRGRRSDGQECCHDVLMLRDGTYWDCLEQAGVASRPIWGAPSGTITDPSRGWVAPIPPQGGVEPPEPPVDPEPPSSDVEARLRSLEQWRVDVGTYVVRTATEWPR